MIIFDTDNYYMVSPITQFKTFWAEVPPLVQKFLIRAFVIFLVWKFAYHLVLKPTRIIDKPLTQITAKFTMRTLQGMYPKNAFSYIELLPNNRVDFFAVNLFRDSKKVIGISDACNGLELFVLYIGFLFCLPNSFKKMGLFIVVGFLIIYLLNIGRCTFIAWLNMNRSTYIDFAHHYLFKLVVYAGIFGGWMLYLRGGKREL